MWYLQFGVKVNGVIVEIDDSYATVQSEYDLISVPLEELTRIEEEKECL